MKLKGRELVLQYIAFFSPSDSKGKFRFNIIDEWRAETVEMWLVECQMKKMCQQKLTASDRLQMLCPGSRTAWFPVTQSRWDEMMLSFAEMLWVYEEKHKVPSLVDAYLRDPGCFQLS